MFKKLFKKHKGFTLLELIIAVLVLGMLTGLAVPAYTSWAKESQVSALVQEIDTLEKAATVYCMENNSYPIGESYTLEDGDFKNAILQQEDGSSLYLLDTDAIADLTTSMKYGTGDTADGDVFIYSTDTNNVYYAGGLESGDGAIAYSAVPESGVTNVLAGETFLQPGSTNVIAETSFTLTGYVDKDEAVSVEVNGNPVETTVGDTLVASTNYQLHYYEFSAEIEVDENKTNEIVIKTGSEEKRYHVEVGDGEESGGEQQQSATGNNVEVGFYHSIILTEEGVLKGAGSNSFGQLGEVPVGNHIMEMTDLNIANVKDVKCGQWFTVILFQDGTVKTMGRNDKGQLGSGDLIDSATLVDVGLTNVKNISAGNSFVAALLEDGTVMAFGENVDGQLGLGHKNNTPNPTMVPGLNNVSKIEQKQKTHSPSIIYLI